MSQSPLPTSPGIDLPRWRCHKVVHAAKIEQVEPSPVHGWRLSLDVPGTPGAFVDVDYNFIDHRKVLWTSLRGGYFVVYADGYMSFSPAKAFEEGYTRLKTETVTAVVEPGPDPFPPLAPGFGGEP